MPVPGRGAQVVADTVAAPIEQQVYGIAKMMYMSSVAANDGSYTLTVTFNVGTDVDTAQVAVQDRVALAMPVLPSQVQDQGVTVRRKTPVPLMIVNLFSPDGRYDDIYLGNYAMILVQPEIARLPGISDVTVSGRHNDPIQIWLDPDKLAFRNLTGADVVEAISQQDIQVTAGPLGQPPVPTGQPSRLTIIPLGRLRDPEQLQDMILRPGTRGGLVRLKDVARVERVARDDNPTCSFDGRPSAGLSIYQIPGTYAPDVAGQVRAKMEELKTRLPEGMGYEIVHDTTPFMLKSVVEGFKTLRHAAILGALVVLLSLQGRRSALICLVAGTVAIIGTFAGMAALGLSLNDLAILGLVLAVGIVVGDAIVWVAEVEHHIEHGLPPREATIEATSQVSAPVITVGLALTAAFLLCAFMPGMTGRIYRQFGLTITTSMVISAFSSLTLSPALSALLLKPRKKRIYQELPGPAVVAAGGWAGRTSGVRLLGGLLNRVVDAATGMYARMVGGLLRVSVLVLLLYGGLLGVTCWGLTRAPGGFIPAQDKGYLLVDVQLPDSSSMERTQQAMRHVEAIAGKVPGVAHTMAIVGQSILINAKAPNLGSLRVILGESSRRRGRNSTADAIAEELRERCRREVGDAIVTVFGAPPIDGLGTTGGFKMIIEDRADLGRDHLQRVTDQIVERGNKTPGLQGLLNSSRGNTPSLHLVIHRTRCMELGVPISAVFDTLRAYLGPYHVNNFHESARTWQVNIRADRQDGGDARDIGQLLVRNDKGQMIRLATLLQVDHTSERVAVMRYNLYSASAITGNPAAGTSSGKAMALLQETALQELPRPMASAWTELAFMQLREGPTGWYPFALAVACVFLALAALSGSWSLPMAVILVLPLCMLGAVAGVHSTSREGDLFVQIGLVVLVGPACKNAILIVECARQKYRGGLSPHQATSEACRLRLRPILMTSFALIIGVIPLAVASGAGAEMRRSLGVAVFGGMLGVTLFGIFLTPVFVSVILRLGEPRLFSAEATGWVGSAVLGGLLGLVIGFLLARLDLVRLPWALGVGGPAGALAASAVRGVHRTIKPRPFDGRARSWEDEPPREPDGTAVGPLEIPAPGGDPQP